MTAPPLPDLEQQLIGRLSRLELVQGPVRLERISGGLTNQNFLIRSGEPKVAYVARLCEPRPLLGIDRRNEVVCQRAASEWGISPEVVHFEDSLLISRFAEGRPLRAADLREQALLARLAVLLRRLHESWDVLAGEVLFFCPFQVIRTYAGTAIRLQARLPADLADILEDARKLSRRIAPFRPVLCHNDLMPANLIDDGERLWLVDWEYGGVGHPLFDLANVSANASFNEDEEIGLLVAYHESSEFDPRGLVELRLFKAMSRLREALWAAIQSNLSDIDFDYHEYGRENLEAYRAARSRLEPILRGGS